MNNIIMFLLGVTCGLLLSAEFIYRAYKSWDLANKGWKEQIEMCRKMYEMIPKRSEKPE